MAARSPARFLAPLALLGFVLALLLIVSHSSSDGGSSGNQAKSTQEQPTPTSASGDGGGSSNGGKAKGPRFYRVKVGDTPSAIAEKTGVSLSTIEQLNPSLDPQALSPGERIKLRK
jgi:LysM repeat protein